MLGVMVAIVADASRMIVPGISLPVVASSKKTVAGLTFPSENVVRSMGTLNRAWTWVFSGTFVPPLTGLICRMVGAVAVQVWTSIPLFTVRVCDPVWICTVRKPFVAPEVTRLAVMLVGLLTVTGPKVTGGAFPTEIPGPKLAFVVPVVQLVNAPVTATL